MTATVTALPPVIPAQLKASKILWADKPGVAVDIVVDGDLLPDSDLLARDILVFCGWTPGVPCPAECHDAGQSRVVYVPDPPDEDGYDMQAWRRYRDEVQVRIQSAIDDGKFTVHLRRPDDVDTSPAPDVFKVKLKFRSLNPNSEE